MSFNVSTFIFSILDLGPLDRGLVHELDIQYDGKGETVEHTDVAVPPDTD